MVVTSDAVARPALEQSALQAAAGPAWSVRLLEEAGSTNAVAAGSPVAGEVVIAERQTAGRGRLDRTWEAAPGTSLTFSVVVDPGVPDEHWPLVPLLSALAVAEGVGRTTRLDAGLKWPNDVLVEGRKVAGILLERVQPTGSAPLAVIGIGLNVHQAQDELPVPTASSLALAGAAVGREEVFGAVLAALGELLDRFRQAPAGILGPYRERCATIGAEVEVHLPGGDSFTGTATEVDRFGRLVVDGRPVAAGDVIHVRPAP